MIEYGQWSANSYLPTYVHMIHTCNLAQYICGNCQSLIYVSHLIYHFPLCSLLKYNQILSKSIVINIYIILYHSFHYRRRAVHFLIHAAFCNNKLKICGIALQPANTTLFVAKYNFPEVVITNKSMAYKPRNVQTKAIFKKSTYPVPSNFYCD